jgi:hypothetical protein
MSRYLSTHISLIWLFFSLLRPLLLLLEPPVCLLSRLNMLLERSLLLVPTLLLGRSLVMVPTQLLGRSLLMVRLALLMVAPNFLLRFLQLRSVQLQISGGIVAHIHQVSC